MCCLECCRNSAGRLGVLFCWNLALTALNRHRRGSRAGGSTVGTRRVLPAPSPPIDPDAVTDDRARRDRRVRAGCRPIHQVRSSPADRLSLPADNRVLDRAYGGDAGRPLSLCDAVWARGGMPPAPTEAWRRSTSWSTAAISGPRRLGTINDLSDVWLPRVRKWKTDELQRLQPKLIVPLVAYLDNATGTDKNRPKRDITN